MGFSYYDHPAPLRRPGSPRSLMLDSAAGYVGAGLIIVGTVALLLVFPPGGDSFEPNTPSSSSTSDSVIPAVVAAYAFVMIMLTARMRRPGRPVNHAVLVFVELVPLALLLHRVLSGLLDHDAGETILYAACATPFAVGVAAALTRPVRAWCRGPKSPNMP